LFKFKELVKRTANFFGADIVRLPHSPKVMLLGIRRLPIRTVIDVGANSGQFAKYARSMFPKAHLYCFEPLPKPFEQLQQWASSQQDVTLFNLALGDLEGMGTMFHHVEHNTSSSLLATTELNEALYPFTKKQNEISVTLSTLDKTLEGAAKSLSPEILIKLDVQGYEERVISGGSRTFMQAKACIVEVNLDGLYSGQADFKRLVLMLYELGFRYAGNLDQHFDEDGHVIFLDAGFIK
jgi:FkbM family methyltransferase